MIGGQALIEGIMMRGVDSLAIVVRKNDGSLAEKVDELKPASKKYPILGWPVIRGFVNFISMMKLGVSSLNYSASFIEDDESYEPGRFEKWLERRFGKGAFEKTLMKIAMVVGLLLPIGLFILLPTLLAGLLDGVIHNYILRNIAEGAIRILIFLLFLFSVSRMKDIRRTFSYHGAEHKSIFCYEAHEELTVENVRKHSRFHPRCGTSFLFVVMILSILIFSVVTWSNPFIRMALRIALLPVVIALSYELNRFVGRHDNLFTRILRAPGVALQRFTTFEPDDGMIEVGITALKMVIPKETGADKW